jgi:hypothetical protein
MVQRTCTDGFQAPQLRRFFIVSSQSYGGVGWAASGWLLSLNTQSLNDCCDQEQTVKNITAPCSAPQELTQPPWSIVDNGV